ncbi:MAG: LAGLIDADG family homing endonuclease [Candidatus ainarchaeum sp.]|nr:LAGLIDADG family homing endonuclease [Candidatus ainarchaeum sp.]
MNEITLEKLNKKSTKIRVELNKDFLKKLMNKASNSNQPHTKNQFIKKLELKKSNKYCCSTIYSWMYHNNTIPLDKLGIIVKVSKTDWKIVNKLPTTLKSGFRGTKINLHFPIKVNEELGSIVGHILGDGSIDNKYQQVFYSNSNKDLLREFSKNMKKVFNTKPRIWMQKTATFEGQTRWEKRLNSINELKHKRNCGLFYPTICGVILNNYFGTFAIGKNKKITNEIINCPKEFKKGFVRAFYDDECTIGDKSIRVFQDQYEILKEIKNMLIEFEILSQPIKTTIKKNKERFYFDIFRKSNLKLFYSNIGLISSQKKKKLKKIVNKKPHGNDK